jgi:hypothetical protein
MRRDGLNALHARTRRAGQQYFVVAILVWRRSWRGVVVG